MTWLDVIPGYLSVYVHISCNYILAVGKSSTFQSYTSHSWCNRLIWIITLTYWKGRTSASTTPEMNMTMQKTKSTPWYDVTSNWMEIAHEIKPKHVYPTVWKTDKHKWLSLSNQQTVYQIKYKNTEKEKYYLSHLSLEAEDCDQETNSCCDAQTHQHWLGIIKTIKTRKMQNSLNMCQVIQDKKNLKKYSKDHTESLN